MSDPWPPRPPEPTGAGPAANRGPAPADPIGMGDLTAGPVPRDPVPGDPAGSAASPDVSDDALPSANRRALRLTIVIVGILLLAGIAFGSKVAPSGAPTFPPVGATTGPAGAAAQATRASIATALGAVGLQVEDTQGPYRPAEAARLAAAPRLTIRAVLPDDPEHGKIAIYEFRSPAEAMSAADDQAAYVASGIGRVQFPQGTQFTLRVVGSTVVFYAWSAANAPDPTRAAAIATALETQGFGVPIPQ